MGATGQAARPRRRWARRIAMAAGAVCAGAAALLLSGGPQRVAVEYAIARATGGEGRVGTVAALPPRFYLEDLLIAPPGRPEAPVFSLGALDAAYGLYGPAQRFMAALGIYATPGRQVRTLGLFAPRVSLDLRGPGPPNYAFLLPAGGGAPAAQAAPGLVAAWGRFSRQWLAYLPHEVRVWSGSAAIHGAQGSAIIDGLSLEAYLAGAERGAVTVRSYPVRLAWSPGPGLPGLTLDGTVGGRLESKSGKIEGHAGLGFAPVLEGAVRFAAKSAPGRPGDDIRIDIQNPSLGAEPWNTLLRDWLPRPIRFERVQFNRISIAGNTALGLDGVRELAVAGMRIRGLALSESGPPAVPAKDWIPKSEFRIAREGDRIESKSWVELPRLVRFEHGLTAQWTGNGVQNAEGTVNATMHAEALDWALSPLAGIPLALDTLQGRLEFRGAAITPAMIEADEASYTLSAGSLTAGPVGPWRWPAAGKDSHWQVTLRGTHALRAARGEFLVDGRGTLSTTSKSMRSFASGESPLFEWQGRAAGQRTRDGWRIEAAMPLVEFRGRDLAGLAAAAAPFPMAFDSVRVEGIAFSGLADPKGPEIEQAAFDAAVAGLRIGPEDAPWYTGSPRLKIDGAVRLLEGDFAMAGSLAPGQTFEGRVKAGPAGGTIEAEITSGPRATWSALAPAAYREWLAYAPALGTFAGTVSAHARMDGLAGAIELAAPLHGGVPLRLSLEVDGPPAGGAPYPTALPASGRATLKAALGEASIEAAAAFAAGGLSGSLAASGLDPRAAAMAWLGADVLEGLDTRLDASAAFDPSGRVEAELAAPRFAFAPYGIALGVPSRVAVSGRLDAAARAVRGGAIEADLGGLATLRVRGLDAGLTGPRAAGTVEAAIDAAAAAAALAGYEAPEARISMAGPVSLDARRARFEGGVRIETPLIGEAGLPPAAALEVTGAVEAAYAAKRLRGTDVRAEIADKVVLAVPAFEAAIGGDGLPRFSAPAAALDATALPFYTMLFDKAVAEVHAALHGLAFDGQTVSGRADLEVRADTLVLAGGSAALEGLAATAALEAVSAPDPAAPLAPLALAGAGSVQARQLTMAGLTMKDLAGSLRCTPAALRIDLTGGTLYGGAVSGHIEVNLTKATFPVAAELAFDGIDLETFTFEYKPPKTALTGVAHGRLRIEVDRYGVIDFSGALESTENFSLNRDMVAQMLLYGYAGGAPGVRQLNRAIERVLGDDPQRPFDRASAEWRYENAWLTLEAALDSEAAHTLDLSLDTTLDPINLYHFVVEQQQAALAGLDSLRESR